MRDIRTAWKLLFGDDPVAGKRSAPEQHTVLCPFHRERNPSCDVHFGKNVFACRSCGAAGGVLDLVVQAGDAGDHAEAGRWLRARGL